ncbi:putative lipoprotein NlpE involved in copper resistance [Chryseobacterium sp. H1D6B]|uniref:copper resistance protein NlpE n=1 Tax=Chryseobacterium sp. H1D6B TaxID=2940588 RepID=UPI0015CBBACE|nr:copper resistance protein NlpE [Chryseobacterium sp. H1D6B]MDH6250919.1 putative lipoprotein NlpE involved in copper resistance [Chryseobacterium sp. H1D6B]
MKIIIYSFIALTFSSCFKKNADANNNLSNVQKHEILSPKKIGDSAVAVTFSGVLPCADCEGIKTELKLFGDEAYEMTRTFVGDPGSSNNTIEKGRLTLERGFGKDNDASLYILNPNDSKNKEYYVILSSNNNELIKLDEDLKIINSSQNYKLQKTE